MNILSANFDCQYKITKELSSQPDLKLNGKPRKRYYADMVGRRMGDLEIIKEAGRKGKNKLWECYCHNCKSTVFKITPLLRKYTISCGCRRTEHSWKSKYWKGVGEISRQILGSFEKNAKRRKIEYNITEEYMWRKYIEQGRVCALSGMPINFGCRRRGDDVTASLDRIDSFKPYTDDNIQWVHKHINAMKLNHSEEYFIELCKIVANYNK